jgi:excisionase family DNA binding protein
VKSREGKCGGPATGEILVITGDLSAGTHTLAHSTIEISGIAFAITLQVTINNLPSIEPETEKLLTAVQAAEYIGVHVETLRKWARLGKIPRMSLPGKGNDLRFSKTQLDKWIADRSLRGKNPP